MKYYETTYEEYIEAVKKYNLHPELEPFMGNLPSRIGDMGNMILYGPPGVGKYSQLLWMLRRYSGTQLKYDKKIQIQTDKHDYIYHISDIHYEIDMSQLGCNSKILWNDIFMQIVDIISVKTEKVGVVVCKNFHMIHGELLEIFYSYIQQYSKAHYMGDGGQCFTLSSAKLHNAGLPNGNSGVGYLVEQLQCRSSAKLHSANTDEGGISNGVFSGRQCFTLSSAKFNTNIIIHFILITENLSFIPNNILNACQVLPVRRPTKEQYKEMLETNLANRPRHVKVAKDTIDAIECNGIMNIKEIYSFGFVKNGRLPKDLFNIICDNIIEEMISPKKIAFTNFRDIIYDILIYNLEAVDCIWYILNYCIHSVRAGGEPLLSNRDISDILEKSYWFLKYYNNNYRPIYHLESILFYMINKIHGYELPERIGDTGNITNGYIDGNGETQISYNGTSVSSG